MKKIKVLVVDDEAVMAAKLMNLLSNYPSLEMLEPCYDSGLVMNKISRLRPDVVFLDIEMPGLSGLEIARQIGRSRALPAIVLCSVQDGYALQAFQVNALDYLLKPYDTGEIDRVACKLRNHVALAFSGIDSKAPLLRTNKKSILHRFIVNLGDSMGILDSMQIQLIYAKDRSVFIQNIEGKSFEAKLTLQEYEARMDPQKFFRCHRNYIVNVDQIKAISSWFNRGYLLILKGDKKTEISVSRTYVNKLHEYIDF